MISHWFPHPAIDHLQVSWEWRVLTRCTKHIHAKKPYTYSNHEFTAKQRVKPLRIVALAKYLILVDNGFWGLSVFQIVCMLALISLPFHRPPSMLAMFCSWFNGIQFFLCISWFHVLRHPFILSPLIFWFSAFLSIFSCFPFLVLRVCFSFRGSWYSLTLFLILHRVFIIFCFGCACTP